jgi:hypothetical protein
MLMAMRRLEERWIAGHRDTVHALRHPEIFERPPLATRASSSLIFQGMKVEGGVTYRGCTAARLLTE